MSANLISPKQLFEAKQYPKWIKSNPIFSKIETFRKIFPTIGLENFEQKITINNEQDMRKIATSLLLIIDSNFYSRLTSLKKEMAKLSKSTNKINKEQLAGATKIVGVLTSLVSQLKVVNNFINTASGSGKATLSIPADIVDKDQVVIFPKGTGLFKIYDRITAELISLKLAGLSQLHKTLQYKNFSSANMPTKQLTVVFSSDGADGIWDISTMSMRGVHSCQTWDQGVGGNSLKLIGSMVDPFTGIIYLTNGENVNGYGQRMIRRCIVRYVVNGSTKEPSILLEKMYPSLEASSLKLFKDTIGSKVLNTPILYSEDMGGKAYHNNLLGKLFIPLSSELKQLDAKYHPYCDSAIPFLESKISFAKDNTSLLNAFKAKAPSVFQRAIKSNAFTKKAMKPYGVDAEKIMGELRAKEKEVKSGKLKDLSDKFVNFVISKSDKQDPFLFINEQEKECKQFFNNEFGKKMSPEFITFTNNKICSLIENILND